MSAAVRIPALEPEYARVSERIERRAIRLALHNKGERSKAKSRKGKK